MPLTPAAAARPRDAPGRVQMPVRIEVKFGRGGGLAESAGFLASPSFRQTAHIVKSVIVTVTDPDPGAGRSSAAAEVDAMTARRGQEVSNAELLQRVERLEAELRRIAGILTAAGGATPSAASASADAWIGWGRAPGRRGRAGPPRPRHRPAAVPHALARKERHMNGDTLITITGNLVADAELRFTPNGQPVATFRVASVPRFYDKASGEWRDGDALFLGVNVWKQQAENCAESLLKGTRVVVIGRLKQRSYETKEGEKRTVYEVEADDVAVSLKFATAKVTRAARSGGTGAGQGSCGGDRKEDPWASDNGGGYSDEPPF